MFVGEKKSSPEAFFAEIELELGPHLKTMQHHKDKDTAYYLTKSAPDDVTFAFWSSYLEMVEDILLFIRATREGNWSLHFASVRALLPWDMTIEQI